MKKLSVVLATFNEEENIKDCLDSVRNLADEIVVVDGSSIDKTRTIAQKMGAQVYTVPNVAIFHKNKQVAVDKAKGEWILQLDADERVDEDLRLEIKTEVNRKDNPYSGYYLPRKNWFLGRFLTKGGQYPDYVIRLFKRGKGRFPAKTVHEQIEIDGKVGHLTNPLIHLADPTFSRYLIRFNRYTSLDAELLRGQHQRPTVWFGLQSFVVKPIHWFLLTFVRHKGFIDGLPGFIFSLMSALRFPVIFCKLWELSREHRNQRDLRKET